MIFLAKSPLVARFDLTSVLQVLSAAAPLSKETELEACRALGIKVVLQGDDIKVPKNLNKSILNRTYIVQFLLTRDQTLGSISLSLYLNLSSVRLDKALQRPHF